MVLRPALQKQAKLLTMDSFSVTDIYRSILETALKSLRKVTVNCMHTIQKRNVLNIYI